MKEHQLYVNKIGKPEYYLILYKNNDEYITYELSTFRETRKSKYKWEITKTKYECQVVAQEWDTNTNDYKNIEGLCGPLGNIKESMKECSDLKIFGIIPSHITYFTPKLYKKVYTSIIDFS